MGLLFSCGGNGSEFKDGYYTAESAEFSFAGFKEYLTICVSGGKIILVEFNAYNSSGFLKSWDMDYMREMNANNGTYPIAYNRQYGRQFLENQNIDGIDAISGASRSHGIFIELAKTVIRNAREGNRKTALVHIGNKL